MTEGTGSSNPFAKEKIIEAVQAWTRSSITLIDARYRLIRPEEPVQNYRMPSSMLIYTYGGKSDVKLDRMVYHSERFGIFHGGKGTELSIHPVDAQLETFMVLYKAETAPFYKKHIHRLLERTNPFTQLYGFSPENPIFFTEKFRCLYDRWERESAADQLYAKTILYQLIHEVYEELGRADIRFFEPDLVAAAKRYLDEQYAQPLSIQELSSLFPISGSQLSRLFKKRERKSLQEYLNGKRLDAAKRYLRSSHLTIKEIAEGCGFGHELNLIRMFKKYDRMTPSEYRRKVIHNMRNRDIDNDSQRTYTEMGLDRLAQSTGDGELSMFGQTRSKEMILAAALSVMLLLSACASNAPANTQTPSPAPVQSQAQAAPSADTKGEETVSARTRTVSTELGDVEVPADPQRIVYLVGNNVGDILPFGKKVVGVDTYGDPAQRPEQWRQQWGHSVAEAQVVGGGNLEAIMALEPDLIIGSATWASSPPEQLSKIAPTVFYNEMSTLEERMTFFGKLFGMPERAEELIEQYAVKVEAAKLRLIDAGIYDKTIVFVQGVEEGSAGLQGDKTRGIIYEDLGMRAPEQVEKQFFNRENPQTEGFYSPLSLEVIDQYLKDADIIAYTNFAPSVEELEKQLSPVEIWQALPAVKAGNVTFYSITDTLIDFDYASRMVSLDTFVDALLELPIARK